MLAKDKVQLVERMSQVDEENLVRSEKEKVQHERVMVLLDENVCDEFYLLFHFFARVWLTSLMSCFAYTSVQLFGYTPHALFLSKASVRRTSTDPNPALPAFFQNQRDLQQRVGELERSTMTLTMQKNKAEQELHQVDESRVWVRLVFARAPTLCVARICGFYKAGHTQGSIHTALLERRMNSLSAMSDVVCVYAYI